MFLDETYANGDGTDSWCTTDTTIPDIIYVEKTYSTPACALWTCMTGYMQSGQPRPYLKPDTAPQCADRAVYYSTAKNMQFACMY